MNIEGVLTNMDLLCQVCYNVRKKENHWVKIRGKMIPLNLKKHFLILNVSIHTSFHLVLGNTELENRGFCPSFSLPSSFFSVAILSPTFPETLVTVIYPLWSFYFILLTYLLT